MDRDSRATERVRINEKIRVREVRLIGPEGEQIGVVATAEALEKARAAALDLVEVASQANPPVVKIMDYGRFKYEQRKRDRAAQKKARSSEIKRIRLTPKIGAHDFQTKSKMIYVFLEEGHKVKIEMWFRGRENAHPELGRLILDRLAEYVAEVAAVDRPPMMEGRNMVMVLNPKK
ncbi:MAG: translation initiation factor IF-3 [Armatimonadetes bacterium]|nr:translation initiation factor IF-3 [Armatimonadota bacterium]